MGHFLTTGDRSREDLDDLIAAALRFKNRGDHSRPLVGQSVALVFFNPSLRTRASMQVGIYDLGGNAIVLEPGGTSWTLEHREGALMDGDKTEHVAEFVRVLGRYCTAIGVRTFAAMKDWEEERALPPNPSLPQMCVRQSQCSSGQAREQIPPRAQSCLHPSRHLPGVRASSSSRPVPVR